MIVVPANPNLIQVGMIRNGCLKTKFNSTYPTRLNGIISQYEFQESIANINSKISSNKLQIFCIVCFAVSIIGGLALVITGATAASSLRHSSFLFIILLYIGIGLIGFAPIFLTLGCCIVRYRRTNKMRHAIAEESKKYSTRCTWRLNIRRLWTVGYGNRVRTVFIYHVIIDIHRPRNAGLHSPRPASTLRPQSDLFPPPPPYPGHSGAFCSQCGASKSDSLAKFCSSCGYQFTTY